ncbi:VTT domain-containing protein [Cohnella mopanensis]|uniref:VTT domain-containing protein n=1 Tax=Cohnella mopanensis TaxID=2911966 RepID=UPI002105AC80|nr:VTT domain-containing protein [Cohnella mopanensis]
MLELIALPLPGEFIMTYAGLIVYEGQLNWFICILVGGIGTCIGVTISYWIGYRLGTPFFEKYGTRFHFGPDKLRSVSGWYQRYGNRLLLISYFIPGVRHITGLFSGTTRMSFRQYAIYAYSGAFIWVSTFISLGKLLGPKWEIYHHAINRYLILIGIILIAIYLCIQVYRKKKKQIRDQMIGILNQSFEHYRSMGKVKFIIIAALAVFVLFLSLLIGLIEDLLAHEFAVFDEVTQFLIHRIFDQSWIGTMNEISLLGSYIYLVPVFILTSVWISFKGKDRFLELKILVFVILGGLGLNEGLRLWFPSQQTMLSFSVYGFAAYLLFRHYGGIFVRIAAVLGVIVICLAVGISLIFLNVQYPSDVTSGYIIGGVWLSMNVILLEIYRMLLNFNKDSA